MRTLGKCNLAASETGGFSLGEAENRLMLAFAVASGIITVSTLVMLFSLL